MPTITIRGQTYECSEAVRAMLTRRATRDAAPRPARVLDPTPNRAIAAAAAAERRATKDAVDAATARQSPGFYTTARREATNAALRAENAANRARWAKPSSAA